MLTRDSQPVPAPARDPLTLGIHVVDDGVDVAVVASRADRVDVCFFDGEAEYAFSLLGPRGGIWHGHIPGIRPGTEYGFRVYGPWRPPQGLRHNPYKLLLDPYARAISGRIQHGPELYDYDPATDCTGFNCEMSRLDSAGHTVRGVVLSPSFSAAGNKPHHPWDHTVIYEAHVKGLTMHLPGVPAHLRGTYAGLAHPATVSHLSKLGITAIELLPVHAKMSEPSVLDKGLTNYWGYSTLAFFAPEPSYATAEAQRRGGAAVLDEFTGMVHLLHEAGIEVILDVVYNHTCEGGPAGPTVSWRGLDNHCYYLHDEDSNYIDYTGTGNTLDFRHTRVVQLTLDSLRYWAAQVGVDGFRFDLATTVGRHGEHFTPYHAALTAMATDPVLRGVKTIAEPWDLGPFGWRTGQFPTGWADWNDRFRGTLRSFWLSDAAALSQGRAAQPPADLGNRLTGSADLFGHGEVPGGRSPLASINFVTAHDGFTLHDLVSYDRKHNRANGEDGRDGTDDNRSWNHGVEGPVAASDPSAAIVPVRRRSMRNLLASLFFSAGVPMMTAGDEFGRTQQGNNNAYNQDNDISWVDWGLRPWQLRLLETTSYLIRLRRENPALRPARFASGTPLPGDTLPDVSWYVRTGAPMDPGAWHSVQARCFQMLRSGYPTGRDALVVVNGLLEPAEVTLPAGRGVNYELVWDSEWDEPERVFDTFAPGESNQIEVLSVQLYLTVN